MSHFIGKLELEYIRDRNWRVTKSFSYSSKVAHCVIVIPSMTETDLLSTWGIPLASEIFDGEAAQAGALHDYLYSCKMFVRSECDAILREACISTGMPMWKAWIIWCGVRIGGGSHY